MSTRLELTTLTLHVSESTEVRVQRLISENPAVIFSCPSCYMCHVMKSLLHSIGVHPTVIELEEHEIIAVPSGEAPVLFVGGACVGGLETLVGLHLSNRLVPLLINAGALSVPLLGNVMVR
ncbi:hypothetical protein vseg_002652 [Gypsophila vaccaria]